MQRPDPVPWWQGATFYQIYPRSFYDANGDGTGDLLGVMQKLDHVAELGVDGIWLSPFYPSPMRDFGYDVLDHCAVDPVFGSLDDFDRLLARAHQLGLKVLIDMVWSHTAIEHEWFSQSRASRDGPKADWYVWADARHDGSPPTNWQSWMGTELIGYFAATGSVVNDQARTPKTTAAMPALRSHRSRRVSNRRG